MSLLNQYKEQAKDNIKLNMKYKGTLDEAKSIAKSNADKNGPAVEDGVSRDEFLKRYKGLCVVIYLNLAFLTYFLYQIFTSPSFLFGVFSICSITIASIVYFKISFTAWRARCIYNKWEKRSEPMPVYFSDFINEIELNWKELLPLKIKNNKRGQKDV